jgi:hypothetical protein
MKKAIFRTLGLAILVVAGYAGYRFYKQMPTRQELIATAKVQRGEVVIRAFTRGEVSAVRSYSISAPNLFGTVQVTRMAPAGALANEKDLIVEYDDSERQAALEEARLSVQSVDESIKQVKANQGITQDQDQLSLLKAGFAVRSAELDVQKNPVLDAITAKKNILALDQAKRTLTDLQNDVKSRQAQLDSQMAVFQETRNRNLLDVSRELQRIALTKALTPLTGLVSIKQNRAGNFNFGLQMPDIREGDQLQPGMPVADVLDLSEVQVTAKVGELDRANLTEGQDATLQLDSIPDKQFHGKIKSLSGTATTDVFSGDPSKKFDVVFSVDMRELLAGIGMKPADIERIMQTSVANAKMNLGNSSTVPGGNEGEEGGGGGRGGRRGMRGGGEAGAGGDNQGGGRGQGGRAAMTPEQRQKMAQMMQQLQSGTPEERQRMIEQFNQRMGGGKGAGRGGEGRRGAAGTASAAGGQDTAARGDVPFGFGRGAQGEGRSGRGGRGGGQSGVGQAGDNTLEVLMNRYSSSRFTEEERNKAKLPSPPEQDSQLQALLRPGLLADVEIIVEKIPDALHVPAQAIFQKGGKPTVFVQRKNGRFEPRVVQLSKQSESTMVLASGVNAGEIIALSDPTADKSGKKDSGDKKSSGSAMGAMGGK